MTEPQSRSYRLAESGGADPFALSLDRVPEPGNGEVLLRVRASSLNFRDAIIASGAYPLPIPRGRIPLSDGAGEVLAVGAGVSRVKVGDRVVGTFFPNLFGGAYSPETEQWVVHHDGWLTEHKVVAAEALVKIPDSLAYEEAAAVPCAGLTAWSALKGVAAGDTVLTQGSGGVALFAIQLAKAMGARVIATTSSAAKGESLRELGADHVLDYVATPAWSGEVRALTGGLGVDRVVEVGGPETLGESLRSVAMGGHIAIVGVLAGATGGINFMSLFQSQATLRPVVVGSRLDTEALMRLIDRHAIKPVIDSTFAFEEFPSAWQHFTARKLFGKVVIRH